MATNLVDILKGYITPDVISQASSTFGESEGAVSKAISTAIPTLLSGFINKSEDSNVMDNVMGLVRDMGPDSGNVLSNPSSLFTSSRNTPAVGYGSKLLGLLFGSKQSTVTEAIAGKSGIKASSAASILGMIAPLFLSYLGKSGASLSGLRSLLSNQKDSILAAVPAGLNLGYGAPIDRDYKHTIPVHKTESGAGKWLWPLLLLLAVSLGIYFFANRDDKRVEEHAVKNRAVAPMRVEEKAVKNRAVAPTRTTAPFKFKLPNGIEIVAPEYGTEHKLYVWLNDKTKMVDKTTWFNFDSLLFDTGKATLRPESQKQLKNMVEILKAYPKVELKLGGYTDNVGNPKYNMELSDRRAKMVKAEMVKMGIASTRLEAEGYGEQNPVASNITDEGKMMNRRIAVRVTKK